jgi:predicted metallo-beta-lactamase superfamily hydrolase
MSREEIWVLCRATLYNEIIVITKRDYDHWKSYLVTQYEYIAEGRRSVMKQFQELMKERK